VAQFSDGGFRYVPTDTRRSAGDAWSFHFLRASAGGRVVVNAEVAWPVPPSGAGTTVVEYARGPVSERYSLRDDGVEQVFILHEPLGEGDVEISGRVGAGWQASGGCMEGDVVFAREGVPDVLYGAVTVIEADGHATVAPVTLAGDELRITVDGRWLANARYPVAIDPIVGQRMTIQGNDDKNVRNAAIAFDSRRNRYFVVFDRAEGLSATPRDVVGILVNAAGMQAGGEIAIKVNTYDMFNPDVAYNRVTDQYLVVYERDWPPVDTDVEGVRVPAGTMAPEQEFLIEYGIGTDGRNPFVAANPLPGAASAWLVGWENEDASPPDWVLNGSLVPTIGSPLGDVLALSGGLTGLHEDVNGDAVFNVRTGSYLVVFESENDDDRDIKGVLVNGTTGAVTALSGPLSSANGLDDEGANPRLDYSLALDRFWVQWGRQETSIRTRLVTGGGTILGTDDSPFAGDVVTEPVGVYGAAGAHLTQLSWVPNATPSTNDDYELMLLNDPYNSYLPGLSLLTMNTTDVGDRPIHDDRNSRMVYNPYYGQFAAAWEHWTIPGVEQDVQAARYSSPVYPIITASAHFDGDTLADRVVVRTQPVSGQMTWFVSRSAGGALLPLDWGAAGDVPVAGNYAGDARTDYAVWRPVNGAWYIAPSDGSAPYAISWGGGRFGDVPVPADYDGDGRTDLAVFRMGAAATWYVVPSSGAAPYSFAWGTWGDMPAPGDYDNDNKADFAIWRPSNGAWWIRRSTDLSATALLWGTAGDQPVPGDFDGDGADDVAVFRPSTGVWYVRQSSLGVTSVAWGQMGDLAVSGDFTGDGRADLVVWRPGVAATFFLRSLTGPTSAFTWGTQFDLPLAR
jgi:hypothetical protein